MIEGPHLATASSMEKRGEAGVREIASIGIVDDAFSTARGRTETSFFKLLSTK